MGSNKRKQIPVVDLERYEALNFKGIEPRANYRSVSYRIDMLHVLDKKDSAAIIYHILYRWSEYRREELLMEVEERSRLGLFPLEAKEVEERMWIYMSYNDFVRETGGAISYNTVIDALGFLVNKKRVLERRANPDPRFSDYVYRINKEEVCRLLATLPAFPSFVPKGSRGKRSQSPSTSECGTGSPKMGTGIDGLDSPKSGIAIPECGTSAAKSGRGAPKTGTELSQNWDTSQKQHSIPQSSPQETTQQKQKEVQVGLDSKPSAAAPFSIGELLSEEEIALIVAYRQQRANPLSLSFEKMPSTSALPASEKTPKGTQAKTLASIEEGAGSNSLQCPASDVTLTDEKIVQLWEYLRGARYTSEELISQLRAARTLQELELPAQLSVDLLSRVYTTYFDRFWQQKYGVLHLSHLVERERSSGQIRIVRWLHRLLAFSLGKKEARSQVGARRNGEPGEKTRDPLMMWKGRLVTQEQAYQEGYLGGWERFKQGDDPDDDLEATLRRFQAEGKLPIVEDTRCQNG